MKRFSRIFQIYPVVWIFLSLFSPLNAQKVKITKIIDTNLFEINKQDTIKLANIEIPSKTTTDSLLKENFIPYVIKYENKILLNNYFMIEYAAGSDTSQRIQTVYLYREYPFYKDLINEYFILRGYGKYVPLKECKWQKKCEAAEIKARKEKKGIWNERQYFHHDHGKNRVALQIGLNKQPDTGNMRARFIISFENEQNRTFSYRISYMQASYKDLYYDEGPNPPREVNVRDILLSLESNINTKYVGLKLSFHAILPSIGKPTEAPPVFFIPTLGLNIGKINKFYLSISGFSLSQNSIYHFSASTHYFFSEPFNSIHFFRYWYFEHREETYDWEYRLNINWRLYKKLNFVFNTSYFKFLNWGNDKYYLSASMGIGYLFR